MFKKYRRTNIAEMRPIDSQDIGNFNPTTQNLKTMSDYGLLTISISEPDLQNGSPKIGDMVARNPKNHKDQWLVAKEYFESNFELMEK